MKKIKGRDSLDRIEDYTVETVPDADIIVNANETNEFCGDAMEKKLLAAVKACPINRYPSMHGEDLCEMIAEKIGVQPFQVCLGNGSSELLEKLCYAFGGAGRMIAYPNPSFSMYETYVDLADSIPVPFALTEDCRVDPDALISFCRKEKPAVLILCNPNNPTGTYNEKATMEKIIRSVDCLVVMDEAYIEFSNGGQDASCNSTLDLVNRYDNLLVLRTFSKAYGLAGLRIGYGVGSVPVMKILKKVLLPYHVNGLTLAIAREFLADDNYLKDRVSRIVRLREALSSDLAKLGFQVYPSGSNFIMIRPQGKVLDVLAEKAGTDADDEAGRARAGGKYLFDALLDRKILIRNYSQHPLLPGGLRISVGTAEENAAIVEAVAEIIGFGKE